VRSAKLVRDFKQMDNSAWRNHYLPQAYLRKFCDDSGTVCRTFRGPDDLLREKRFAPRATGYEEDLYTLVDAGGVFRSQRPDAIERDVFGPIDDNGARALERVLVSSPSKLTAAERENLTLLVLSLIERHPQRVLERDRIAERIAIEREAALREFFGPPLPGRLDVLEILDVEKLARNLARQRMVQNIKDQRWLEHLKSLTLRQLAIRPGCPTWFVTGDNPVVINTGEPWPLRYFTLALSPRALLFGHHAEEQVDDQLLRGLFLAHNIQLFRQCQYIFSQERLQDNQLIRTRYAASTMLKPVAWDGKGRSAR
jgi:hypothetical protein